MNNWDYGGFYKKYKMEGDIKLPSGIVRVLDIINEEIPNFAMSSDCIFVDPPCSNSNLRSFYTKNDMELMFDIKDFNDALLGIFEKIKWQNLFIECFKSNVDFWLKSLEKYGVVHKYNNFYYKNKKNVCFILHVSRNSTDASFIDGVDETKAIDMICQKIKFNSIFDPCIGRGTVGICADRHQKMFFGTELNKKRLAVLVDYFMGKNND